VWCGLNSTGSGQGPVAGCCECGDEPLVSCATELVIFISPVKNVNIKIYKFVILLVGLR
jgi:hypothetical protein